MAHYTPLPPPEKRDRLRLEKARAIAAERGGLLISKFVKNSKQKIVCKCGYGHRWKTRLDEIQMGKWCPECQKPALEDLQRLAAKRGGKCLATAYIDARTKTPWQCAKGHRWMSTWDTVLRHWCPKCAKTQKLELQEFVRIARQRGGKLLSTEYINGKTPLLWQCAKRHTWWARPTSVKARKYADGAWCRVCAYLALRRRRKSIVTLKDMCEIARERGGQCLSKFYVDVKTKMQWRCAKGHEWMANRMTIKRSWCPQCAKRLNFEQVEATAGERGGKVLSPRFKLIDGASVLQWQCAAGHHWKMAAARVRAGIWCRRCKDDSYWSLQDAQELARKHGGTCLSRRYVSFGTVLGWQCGSGHVFKLSHRQAVRRDSLPKWCPDCSRYKYTIEDAQRMAGERSGECLSAKSGSIYDRLKWRCARGHVWRAVLKSIVKGNWCAACVREEQGFTLKGMREIARAHGGKCLSKKYVNSKTPLLWRCGRGHLVRLIPWVVQARAATSEQWCTVCRCQARQGGAPPVPSSGKSPNKREVTAFISRRK